MAPRITRIDRHYVEVPFRSVPGRNLDRRIPGWRHFEIIECELSDASVGFGETMLDYTWGETPTEPIERAEGSNAAAMLQNSTSAPALEMALFDALGRSLDIPAHRLIGEQVREAAPVAWWCIDMPAEDWVDEAERAVDRGYTAMKAKGRPWFDLRAQVDALEDVVPEGFKLNVDFNETMQTAEDALPVLKELEKSPIVTSFEDPVGRTDVEGNKRLRRELDVPLANHYGFVDPTTAIQTNMFDVALIAGPEPTGFPEQSAVVSAADWPAWIQMVGTGITAAMAVQLGAVLEPTTWPAVTAHEIYDHPLLTEPLPVEDGAVPIPETPGLGVTVDRDAIEQFRVDGPEELTVPDRLAEVSWPDGRRIYFACGEADMMTYAQDPDNEMPYFTEGVTTRLIPDDGSDAWQDVHRRAGPEPLVIEPGEDGPFDDER
jgi:galactonate dehydratase